MNTECCQYPEKKNSSVAFSQETGIKENDINVYRSHKIYMGYLDLYFCVIDFKETIFISVNDNNNELNDLQASYPIKYADADNIICLVGEPHSYGNDVANLLSMKFKIPFYVSVNVDESDENLTNFIFSNCLEMIKPLFENREKN
ncbi:proteasome assembly chaperone 4, putative [Plasmodium vinckei lentum]|uniref:Proteasome assembly chaperone 4, putative n=1 Tax=Plasmodium vinckei lentum TaxID=138297 RepID=A0A6V7RYX0_PLAVN|nr:proteasome assembly chaperone 4, putative [Plasmodium vinckei lentum]